MTVFEKADRIGGLLRYGIPEFKMEKRVLDRRLELLEAEGVVFRPGSHVGVDVPAADLRRDFDAVLLAGGAGQPRDLAVPGRELDGVHFAMDYLTQQNRRCEGDVIPDADVHHRRRQARRDHRRRRHRRRLPRHRASPGRARRWPSSSCCRRRRGRARPTIRGRTGRRSSASRRRTKRAAIASMPWPPRASPATPTAACGAARANASSAASATAAPTFAPVPGSEFEMPADLVLLAMGFAGPPQVACSTTSACA